jgi:uncharacterized membrane protein YphA (DoxX/SURF4 family)
MRTNPFSDGLFFLTENYWATPTFWVILIVSVLIAAVAFAASKEQRTIDHLVRYFVRGVVGLMWWQQSLWKVPPDFDSLRHWVEEMIKNAAFPIQAQVLQNVVLPNFMAFGYLIYSLEVIIGISLIIGLFVRATSTIGALMILNIYLGLYRSDSEWPWTYAFLVLLMIIIAVERYGRSLGADALIAMRAQQPTGLKRFLTAVT